MTTQGTTRRWVGGSEREPHTRFRCLNLLDEHPFGKGKKPGGIHDNLTSPTSRQGGVLSKELYHSLSSEESGAQPAADTQKAQKPLVNCEASLELKKGRKSARLGQPVRCTKSVPEPILRPGTMSSYIYDYHMYNNRHCSLVSAEGAAKNSITVASASIVSRAVLLDFPRALNIPWLPEDHHITVEEIEYTLSQQSVGIEPGDILLFRTGHMARFRSSGEWNEYTYTNAPGPCLEVLPWLHEHQIAAVASDTWGFEAVPSKTPLWLPIHAVGIVYMGLMLGENFLLDEWANDCAVDGVYEAFICAGPIPFSRAVGAPVNPLVVK